jgi:WD40 repeat protein
LYSHAVLVGHDTTVLSLAYSSHLDLCASGARDGSVVVHRVRKARFVRRLMYPSRRPVDRLHLCAETGVLTMHSHADAGLAAFSLNGFPLARLPQGKERLSALLTSKDGQFLLTGGEEGVLSVRQGHSLKLLHTLRVGHGPITSLAFTPDHQYILVGCEDGSFSVVADPLSRLQMLHRVLSRTFFGVI